MTSLFDKLAATEEKFFESKFLSPVLKNKLIRVRIDGIVLEFKVRPKNFEGWGIFVMHDRKTARFVDEPSLKQKSDYLELYPRFHLIVCQKGDEIRGILSNKSDDRVKIEGRIPVSLPVECQLFDEIHVRFDGSNFWFESTSNRSPRIAESMREALISETKPESLNVDGITFEEKMAYAIAYDFEIESKKDLKEERLKKALERGGATLRSYIERGDTYSIEFEVDGERHKSTVDADTLSVKSAGICLTDHRTGRKHDGDFDLQSLVGVIREGSRIGKIVRM